MVQSAWVSHAAKSDSQPEAETMEGCANKFSNVPQTNLSSRGAMLTGNKIDESPSFAGARLHLNGLEPELNCRVRARKIIFHRAVQRWQPASDTRWTLTHTEGCLALKPSENKAILEQLVGRALVYVHQE